MDIDELRTIGQNSNEQKRESIFAAAGVMGWIIAVGIALALGSGVVIAKAMRPDTMNPIQANALPTADDISTNGGSAEFDKALASCLRVLNRRKAKPNAVDQMNQMMEAMETEVLGARSKKHGKLVECLSGQRRHLLCKTEFRRGFVKVVEEFIDTGSAGRNRMALAEGMAGDKHWKNKKSNKKSLARMKRRKKPTPGISRLRSLFREGYLQPKHFSTFLLGTPAWVTKLTGEDFKPRNACKR